MEQIQKGKYFLNFNVYFVDREKRVINSPLAVDHVLQFSSLENLQQGKIFIGRNEIAFYSSNDSKAYVFYTHLIRGVQIGKLYDIGFGLIVEAFDGTFSCYVFLSNGEVPINSIVHYCRLVMPIKWQYPYPKMDPSTSQFKRHRRIRDSRRQFAQKQPTKPLVDQSKVKKTSWSVRNCQKNMMGRNNNNLPSNYRLNCANQDCTVQSASAKTVHSSSRLIHLTRPQNRCQFGLSQGSLVERDNLPIGGGDSLRRRLINQQLENSFQRHSDEQPTKNTSLSRIGAQPNTPTEKLAVGLLQSNHSTPTTNELQSKGKRRRSIASPRVPSRLLNKVLNQRHSLGLSPRKILGKENIAPSEKSMPDTAADSGVDLEQLLKSETARASFQNFLQQQFCIENLNFYLAVEEYKQLKDEGQRRELGRQIFERHFTQNCIEPVNIDNATCKGIVEAIKSQNYSQELYNLAQYQIYHLLKYDVWPRFLSSGGKAPTASELAAESKKGGSTRKGNSSSARSTNSTTTTQQQLTTTTEKQRDKRRSFFRFLRRNNKDQSQENEGSPTCSIKAIPCTSKQQMSSGVYGEIEPCTGSAGELRLSLSPATTKRRMTRERSVPASSSRSASSTSTAMVISQTDVDEDTGRLSLTVCRTRAMSSRENNTNSTDTSQKIPSVCVLSPETTSFHKATAKTANSQTPSLPSTSKQKPCTSSTGSRTSSVVSSSTNVTSSTSSAQPPPHIDPRTAILHDEKERFLSSSDVTHQGQTNQQQRNKSHHNNDYQRNTSSCEKPAAKRPALFTSSIGSTKEAVSDESFQWQKADYV